MLCALIIWDHTLTWASCLSWCPDFTLSICCVHAHVSREQTLSVLRWWQSCCWIHSRGSCSGRRVIMGSTVLIWLLSGPQRRRLILGRDFQGRMMYTGVYTREGCMGRDSASCDWGWQVCGHRFGPLCFYLWSVVIVLVSVSFWVMVSSKAWGLTVTSNRRTEVKQRVWGGVCASVFLC